MASPNFNSNMKTQGCDEHSDHPSEKRSYLGKRKNSADIAEAHKPLYKRHKREDLFPDKHHLMTP